MVAINSAALAQDPVEDLLAILIWWVDNRNHHDKQSLKPGIHLTAYKTLAKEFYQQHKKEINKLLIRKTRFRTDKPVIKRQTINRALIESYHAKQVLLRMDTAVVFGRLEVGQDNYDKGRLFMYLNGFRGNEYCLKLDYRKPLQRARILTIELKPKMKGSHYFKARNEKG